jgi:UDP-glucose 4-epimerase
MSRSAIVAASDLVQPWQADFTNLDASAFGHHQIESIVHCAAKVHAMHEGPRQGLNEYQRVNVRGTIRLARLAAAYGVRRFVFVSSVKVNGDETAPGRPFAAADVPQPSDAYAVSKWTAEQQLLKLGAEEEMDITIVRPVLIYGPGVKANFLTMLRWLDRGIPLPLGAIDNRRSLVAVDNLVDFISACLVHPAAAGQTFMVSDGEDLSTTELLKRLALFLGRPARLIPVPVALLEAGAAILGKGTLSQRLCRSLQVDISQGFDTIGWQPLMSVDKALQATAIDYLKSKEH